MEFKDHLIELFEFNDNTNKKLFKKVEALHDQAESIRYVSHLINCQYKWMARLTDPEHADELSWWEPLYSIDQFEAEWDKSIGPWFDLIRSHSDEELTEERAFIGYDGGNWAATPRDVALQLNFHSIHHRAQIQTIIRSQGVEPDFVDYIGTRARKLD
jgi:uncharacterized damage-inducible protein DinB